MEIIKIIDNVYTIGTEETFNAGAPEFIERHPGLSTACLDLGMSTAFFVILSPFVINIVGTILFTIICALTVFAFLSAVLLDVISQSIGNKCGVSIRAYYRGNPMMLRGVYRKIAFTSDKHADAYAIRRAVEDIEKNLLAHIKSERSAEQRETDERDAQRNRVDACRARYNERVDMASDLCGWNR